MREDESGRPPAPPDPNDVEAGPIRLLGGVGIAGIALILGIAVVGLPPEPGTLAAEVEGVLAETGVEQPVTAVLLNLRAWDTWLELVVLLLALAGTLGLHRRTTAARAPPLPAGPILDWTLRGLAPVAVLTGGYLLWLGTHAAGGAFQAGAVLAATLILVWLGGHASVTALSGTTLRVAACLGILAFGVAALSTLAARRPALDLPAATAGTAIVIIEAAAALAVAITLSALFLAAGMRRA